MFFWRGFANLRRAARTPDLAPETRLFASAVQGSLFAYVVGAQLAPEAYQFFPLFAVAYTSVLVVVAKQHRECAEAPETMVSRRPWRRLSVYTRPPNQSRPSLPAKTWEPCRVPHGPAAHPM
jgi:hypothetical protein